MSGFSFLAKTALRDSRRNRGRLLMFMSSIILGVMALVAINSFNHNLVKDIDNQTKSILGADIQVEGNKPMSPQLQTIIDSLPGERASQQEFFSMAIMPKTGETQFTRIKALEGGYPFYGELITKPVEAKDNFQRNGEALVDDALMFEHQLEVGDKIKLGEKLFTIGGRLMSSFGSVSLGASFAPTIYIDQTELNGTELLGEGSLIEYKYFIKTPEGFEREEWDNNHDRMSHFRNEDFRVTTIEDQRRQLNRAFDFLNSFLNLVALVALLLGCIGVASSVFIYVKTKIPSIAVLRCIGMKGNQAFLVYFLQIFVLGFFSVAIGVFLGSLLQVALPVILQDVLPYKVELSISWQAVAQGMLVGTIVTGLFALVPLLGVRLVSPLRTLRTSLDDEKTPFDLWKWLAYVGIILSIFGFLWSLTDSVRAAVTFSIGLLVAFGLLYLMSTIVMWLVRKVVPSGWSFVFRQGLANLYRPNNQTRTLIISIGLGTSILTILFIIQGLILNNVCLLYTSDAADE